MFNYVNKNNIMSELISEIAKQAGNKVNKIQNKQYLKYGITKESYNFNGYDYCLLNYKNLFFSDEQQKIELIKVIAFNIKKLAGNVSNVLVVGLGNRHLSADSLGSETLKHVIATRGLYNSQVKISAISTSVLGLTGIESADIIKSVKGIVKPDLIILIDTLCATNYTSLGCNFQLSTMPLSPGHGVGNKRKTLNNLLNKTKVISIGVPLVVYAKTFITNAIETTMHSTKNKPDIATLNELLKNNFDGLVLTVKDVNMVVKTCGGIIGAAINKAFNNYSLSEQKSILQKF